jgi:hypothetical protein
MTPGHSPPSCWCCSQHGIPGIPPDSTAPQGLCRACAERTPEECSAAHAAEAEAAGIEAVKQAGREAWRIHQQQGKEAG